MKDLLDPQNEINNVVWNGDVSNHNQGWAQILVHVKSSLSPRDFNSYITISIGENAKVWYTYDGLDNR